MLSMSVRWTIDNNVSNTFSLFQLESMLYKLPHRFFFGNVFIHKNLNIEPFNYSMKSVCFDFRSTNVGSSVIKIGRSEVSMSLPFNVGQHYL